VVILVVIAPHGVRRYRSMSPLTRDGTRVAAYHQA